MKTTTAAAAAAAVACNHVAQSREREISVSSPACFPRARGNAYRRKMQRGEFKVCLHRSSRGAAQRKRPCRRRRRCVAAIIVDVTSGRSTRINRSHRTDNRRRSFHSLKRRTACIIYARIAPHAKALNKSSGIRSENSRRKERFLRARLTARFIQRVSSRILDVPSVIGGSWREETRKSRRLGNAKLAIIVEYPLNTVRNTVVLIFLWSRGSLIDIKDVVCE